MTFLDALYEDVAKKAKDHPLFNSVSQQIYERMDLRSLYTGPRLVADTTDRATDPNNFWLLVDILCAHGLLHEAFVDDSKNGQDSVPNLKRNFHFTDLGAAFVFACRPPD